MVTRNQKTAVQLTQRKGGAGAAAKRAVLEALGWRTETATAEVQTASEVWARKTLQDIASGSDAVAARAAGDAAGRLLKGAVNAVQRQVKAHVRLWPSHTDRLHHVVAEPRHLARCRQKCSVP